MKLKRERKKVALSSLTNPIEKAPPWWHAMYADRIVVDDVLTDEVVDRMADDLMEWAMQPQALKLSQFFLARRIPERTFYRLVKRTPKAVYAHDYAMGILANRREICAALGELEPAMIKPMMPQYDPQWKEQEEWRATIKVAQEAQTQTMAHTVMIQLGPNGEVIDAKVSDGTPQ